MSRSNRKAGEQSPADLRHALETEIERLIALLDKIDGDENLEADAEGEPSISQAAYIHGMGWVDDLEDDGITTVSQTPARTIAGRIFGAGDITSRGLETKAGPEHLWS